MTKEKNESQRICLSSNGEISRLLEIMKRLRDPKDGCPWDIEQTYETIAPYTIEEAYEVSDAIDQGNWHELEGELGGSSFTGYLFHTNRKRRWALLI